MSRPSDVRTAVLAAEQRFFDALLRGDAAALDDLLADDFLIVEVMAGSVVGRADFVAAVTTRQVEFESIESFADEAVVREFDGAAVVVGRTEQRLRLPDGRVLPVSSRYTHVFTRRADGWLLASAQGTPIG